MNENKKFEKWCELQFFVRKNEVVIAGDGQVTLGDRNEIQCQSQILHQESCHWFVVQLPMHYRSKD